MQNQPDDHAVRADSASASEGGFIFNVLTGASLGGLVGLLIGLSASPIVASASAAILALLVTFFGFGGTVGALQPKVSAARVLGFGILMSAGLIGGIVLRAEGTLGPSFKQRVGRFEMKELPKNRAIELAIFEHSGLLTGSLANVSKPEKAPATSAYAFASEGDGPDPACGGITILPGTAAKVDAMTNEGGDWAVFGRAGDRLPAARRDEYVDAILRLKCGYAA